MVALSFGKFGNAFNPSSPGLSFGTAVLDSPSKPKVYSGRGSAGMPKPKVYSGRGSVGMPSPPVQRVINPLSFGKLTGGQTARDQFFGHKTTTDAPLTFGGAVKKLPAPSATGIGGSGGLSHFLKTLSFGTPVTSPARASSTVGLPSVPQIDTVTLDGGAGYADATKNLASKIFGDMVQPASYGGELAGSEVSGGFMDRIGPVEIALAALAVGTVVMLASGGKPRRRRR